MIDEVFNKENQEAKITIEIGNYKVIMEGSLEPPEITTDRFEENIYSRRNFAGGLAYNDMREVSLRLRPKSNIKIQQFRWSIPLAIPPRIEE